MSSQQDNFIKPSNPPTQSCGIVYVATKLDRYVEEAFLSAESVKRHAPGLNVTLFTDRPGNRLCEAGCFDSVQPMVSQGGFGLAWAEGQLDRITCLSRTPYSHTLHLDTDTRAFSGTGGTLPTVFRVLEEFDLAMVEDPFELSYACKHTGRRMFNGGFILYRMNERVSQWLRIWEERVRRNFTLGLENPVPVVPELARVTDDDVRRQLLRIDQIALMEIASPEVNQVGLRISTLDDSWNYRGTEASKRSSVKIVHSDEYKVGTKADVLKVARAWRGKVMEDSAEILYSYVADAEPQTSLRKSWQPWKKSRTRIREEWATPKMRRVHLHLRYGQTDAAVELLASMKETGDQAFALTARAQVALRAAAIADAVELASAAIEASPQSAYANAVLGEALLAAQRPIDAIAPLAKAVARGYAEALFFLGNAWFELKNYRKAAACYTDAVEAIPGDDRSANNLVPALLGMRRYRTAVDRADQLLATRPGHTAALAFKCIALGELGQVPELAALASHERLLTLEQMPAPQGYRDIAAFNRALAQEISRDPSLSYEPHRHTTRRGHQTLDLANRGSNAIRQLNSYCIAVAERRRQDVSKQSAHPFDGNVPRVYKLHSWAVILEENGHQMPHIHPGGWLSGVYYAQVPEEVNPDDPERNGWLEFGRGDERWHRPDTVMPVRQICPHPGLLVTFPSFFWHNTRPLRSKQRRISFSFDIVPL